MIVRHWRGLAHTYHGRQYEDHLLTKTLPTLPLMSVVQLPIGTRARSARPLSALILACIALQVRSEEPSNWFNDPFLQATSGIASCPAPRGPEITRAEMLAQSHVRAERGATCYRMGRCRLPNSYLYDKEIIARVKKAIDADGRFADTSIWLEGKRRWVWLKGCVRSNNEAKGLEQLVRSIDDVEAVINELVIKQK